MSDGGPTVIGDEQPRPTPASDHESGVQALHRISWKSVLQVVMLILTVAIIIRAVAGLDLSELAHALGEATWGVVLLGLVLSQAPPVMQAISTIGASPLEHSFGPVYLLQLAQAYVGIAVPTSAARIAMDVRFLQKQGMAAGAALASGAIESLAGFVVEILLLGGLLIFTPQSLQFDLAAPSLPDWRTILLILVALAAILGVAAIAAPRRRLQLQTWVRKLLEDTGVDPDKGVYTHSLYGNTASASVGVTYKQLLEERTVRRGDKVVLGSAASGLSIVMATGEWTGEPSGGAHV